MQAAHVRPSTFKGYTLTVRKYVIAPLGEMYLSEVTADDIKLAMVPVSKRSEDVYNKVNMLFKSIFYSAEYSNLIKDNPAKNLNAKGGIPKKEKEALTDAQAEQLLDTIKDLPPYVFVMIGLYSGLRREEILALQWDCVHLEGRVFESSVKTVFLFVLLLCSSKQKGASPFAVNLFLTTSKAAIFWLTNKTFLF